MSARIELITTGSELLLGFSVNTHVNYIARQLDTIGLRLCRQCTIADDRRELRAAIAEALDRSDVILITGGLGPTVDDCTRDVVAELLSRPLVRNEAIAAAITERFRKRGIRLPDRVLVQARIPTGAQILPNSNGTAPGLALEDAGKLIVLLPGPPRELKPMFEQYVVPVLEKNYAPKDRPSCRVFRVVGLAESIVEERIGELPGVELGFCAKMGEVEVRIIGKDLAEAERHIRAALGDHIYGTDDDRLEEVVVKLLAGKTLAIAESCTGGLIANRITNVSGASKVFLTGFVTYSNESKIRLLGVREETLANHGAVSEEACREMAEGARRHADYALATTGIAGPTGGTPEKPVGLVYIGLATPTRTEVRRHVLLFDRETFKFFASQYALDLLRRELLANRGGLRQPALPETTDRPQKPVGRAALSAPRPRRKTLNHDIPPGVRSEDAPFFLTICCRPRGKNQLCEPGIATKLFDSIEVSQKRGDWWVKMVLLMPDHLHALISFPATKDMRKVVADWKRLLARRLGVVWQRDFFEHRIRAEESLRERADYILNNPVRAGLVARAEEWPYVWRPEQRRDALRAARPTRERR
jgi:nicotinamide-nucleotide amidase